MVEVVKFIEKHKKLIFEQTSIGSSGGGSSSS